MNLSMNDSYLFTSFSRESFMFNIKKVKLIRKHKQQQQQQQKNRKKKTDKKETKMNAR